MIRVLITDDSDTARGLLASILKSDPNITVVGEAKNGLEAVTLAQKLRPDVITMDIEMPGMDGLEATQAIMIAAPTPIVIVSASNSIREVETARKALRAGALTVLTKPLGPRSPGFDEDSRKLIWNVKTMADVKVVGHRLSNQSASFRTPHAATAAAAPGAPGRVVAIATSTGGPPALATVLSGLPRDFAAPILVVQHIAEGFTPGLVSWLNTISALRTKVAEHGEPLVAGVVYFGPDHTHLGMSARRTIQLSHGPPVGGFRPSGTPLFESVGAACGAATIGVIMTGMGDDGVAGLRTIRQAGGHIIAQDQETSVIFGMPGAAVEAGLPNEILPLPFIGKRLADLVHSQAGSLAAGKRTGGRPTKH